MAQDVFRWGILGPGHIAARTVPAIVRTPGLRLEAVASRDLARAQAFAAAHGAAKAYGSYRELAEDPDVDAVYVATPNAFHCEQAVLCLSHGKAVLVEKPFALNAAEGRRMAEAARTHGAFLMEAMWTRFVPAVRHLRSLLASGALGAPRLAVADFSFSRQLGPETRLLSPALGGGALLDLGVYCLSFASLAFGPVPDAVSSYARLGPTGVDVQDAVLLRYAGGGQAQLSCGFEAYGAADATLLCADARVALPSVAKPEALAIVRPSGSETLPFPFAVNGYEPQFLEVRDRVREGALASPEMALSETLATLELMDALRRDWGVRYPQE